ncbi:MAG: aminopeptidase [Candidatus Cloacimonetes bacterium]|nr:aminopeptidase [Candidatus Cloacimonadota bacterium]
MDYLERVEPRNELVRESYEKSILKIKEILDKLQDDNRKYALFLKKIGSNILFFHKLKETFYKGHFLEMNLKELEKLNLEIYSDIKADNYETNYANPKFSTSIFGKEQGGFLSALFDFYISYAGYIRSKKFYKMEKWNRLFINAIELYNSETGELNIAELRNIYQKEIRDITTEDQIISRLEQFANVDSIPGKIIREADLNENKYLYHYLKNITENELKTAEFLQKFPTEKTQKLSKEIVKAYIRGFEVSGKDISKKEIVYLYYNIGQEIIIRQLKKTFEEKGLEVRIQGAVSTSINRQLDYDHRFDNSLYIDQEYMDKVIKTYSASMEAVSSIIQKNSGTFYFDKFGELPFKPEQKEACLKLNEKQQQLVQENMIKYSQIWEKYVPRQETSFGIIAFPVPEIGNQFEDIFEDTMHINMLDTLHWEDIQQKIVDVLDLADFVHVKGKDGNVTDIKVKMQKLQNPDKETNFVNCGADVNIPVGEVFTSPQLKGTNGILHLQETFLGDLKYENLKLTFTDGFVTEYSCTNFEDEEKNKKFIEENLLFPHKTLPLGEFAIGTNTLAYVMAQKYNILHLLPVLIVEKMGPHFAIGDTCFSWEEDFKVYNPIDGKEITARENEVSALRNTDIQKAYTNVHTDITLPYEKLDFITSISKSGEKYDIIRDGKFAIAGTEEFNVPLIKMLNY